VNCDGDGYGADDDDIRWLTEQRLYNKSLPWYNKPSLTLLLITLFFLFLSEGVSLSAYIILTLKSVCKGIMEKESNYNKLS